jgi:hypothetical protein
MDKPDAPTPHVVFHLKSGHAAIITLKWGLGKTIHQATPMIGKQNTNEPMPASNGRHAQTLFSTVGTEETERR